MSRALLLLPSVPDPPDAGAKLRNLALLRTLRGMCEVDAIAFGRSSEHGALAALTRHTVVVDEPNQRGVLKRAVDLATTPLPDMALRTWSRTFAVEVKRAMETANYEFVQAEGIEMAPYLALVPPSLRVYDAHNAEFLLQRRASEAAAHLEGRLYSRLQWRRLERFERCIVRSSRLTTAVSQHDANQLLALAGGEAHLEVIPNAIDAQAYVFRCPETDDAPNVLFLGKLDYRANAEAMQWFIGHVLPRLHEAVPAARLFAVGAAPPRWMVERGQHDDRVVVTGHVADERAYLARSSVLVLPVRMGGGSRFKALVAMASGVPIVSTRLGMEGLDAEPDVHYVCAESPDEWAAALWRVLGDVHVRQRLAVASRGLVEQRYDLTAIGAALHAAYSGLIR